VSLDEVEAVQVGVAQVDARAELMVEQGQLHAELPQRLLDRGTGPPAASLGVRVLSRRGSHRAAFFNLVMFSIRIIFRTEST
jgi:hypothetical protein